MAGMDGIDKAAGRVGVVITLLLLAGASVRGYLPAAGRAVHRQSAASPATLLLAVVPLGVSLAIVVVALINRVRNRRAVPAGISAGSVGAGTGSGRPSWRVVLVGVAVVAAWLLLIWLAMQLAEQYRIDSLTKSLGVHTDGSATGSVPATAGGAPPPKQPSRNSDGDVFGYLPVAVLVILTMIVGGVLAGARIRRNGPQSAGVSGEHLEPTVTVAVPQSLARAAELGLAEIGDLSREPREAIIACYAAMERQLGRVPDAAPQEFDTPTEVLARAVENHALPADNATQLVSLFAEARFSRHLMTERHREYAVRSLRLVLDELRTAV